MQNKGFVKIFALLLTLVCVFYLSFSLVTNYHMGKMEKISSELGQEAGELYLDSVMNEKVWLGAYTLKQCREMEIGLGLDLKGGMNVILEVSVPDVVRILADHKTDPAFVTAVNEASKQAVNSQEDFISLFLKAYKKEAPEGRLAEIFATQQLKGKVTTQSTDAEVESAIRSEVEAACKNSFNVLRTRIDRFGVAQPNIQELEGKMGRIMIEMPGVKEPERVRKLLQGSANLEFWETYNTNEIVPYLSSLNSKLASIATPVTEDSVQTEKPTELQEQTEVAEETTQVSDSTTSVTNLASALGVSSTQAKSDAAAIAAEKAKNPLFALLQPMQNPYGSVVGYAHYRDTAEINALINSFEAKDILPRDLQLKWGVKASSLSQRGEIFELYAIKSTERDGRAPLEGDVIVSANDEFDQFNKPCVSMSMNTDGARRWAQLTKANVGRSVAIVLDGYVYSAPNVNTEITGGNSQISGNFTIEDTKDLANVLKSGKMPAPTTIVQEDIVGPSLGQESINQGITSFVIAFILLMIYMCTMYGLKGGMVANAALIINFFLTLGVLTSFQAALTMSGIAGMVLSLGMAVDANVLIYERTKEELRAGKKIKEALAAGYKNAFWAIFDSNITSMLTGFILFNFGTGPIRGFATTLMIGIAVSFFTAVFLTRVVYEHFLNKDKWLNLNFSTSLSKNLMQNTKFHFMGAYKKSFTIFGVILLVCIASLLGRGLSKSIDFTGGRNYVVQFEMATQPEEIRTLLAGKMGEDANVSVIAQGTDGRSVRISTNYRVNDTGASVDEEIEAFLYTALKDGSKLGDNVTLQHFIDRDSRDGGSIISSQKVGPSIAEDITYGAIISVIFALIAIFLYILIRFRNVAFSVGAVASLAVDTILIIGAYSLCWGWMPFSLDIDQTFIGAILTAIGYSVNDKVVIFDRIREFLGLYPKRDRKIVFNDSLNTTLARTVNTSLSTLVVLLCIFFLGGDSIRSFAFAMILGVVVGTLTSLFIAAPTTYIIMNSRTKGKSVASTEETK